MKNNEFSRFTIDLPKKMHRQLKAQAVILGKSMREIVLEALQATNECRLSSHSPNAKTIKAMRNVEAGKNLTEAKNLEDLYKLLGI